MPRKAFVPSDFYPYHVTARANNREVFPLDMQTIWDCFTSELWISRLEFDIEVQSFVLMPNHFHLIVTTPDSNLDKVMNKFMSSTTRRINQLSGRSGHLFGGPYHWSLIKSARYYSHALKYIYRNPPRAGLSSGVDDYKYSTYFGLMGNGHLPIPLTYTRAGYEHLLPGDEPIDWLAWLNTPFLTEIEQLIRRGLRHKMFYSMIDPNTRRPIPELEVSQ